MLIALVLGALGALSPAAPDHSLDGVYGHFPIAGSPPSGMSFTSGPAVQIDGPRMRIGMGDWGSREARVHVDPERHLLTIDDEVEGQIHRFTYDVLEGELVLSSPDGPSVSECATTDDDARAMPWSVSVGPVGLIPAPDQSALPGRWWAEGHPATRITEDGTVYGWSESSSFMGPIPDPAVQSAQIWVHGPMGHGDGVGDLLWFLTTDDRLYVHKNPACCELGNPTWAVLERVE